MKLFNVDDMIDHVLSPTIHEFIDLVKAINDQLSSVVMLLQEMNERLAGMDDLRVMTVGARRIR